MWKNEVKGYNKLLKVIFKKKKKKMENKLYKK